MNIFILDTNPRLNAEYHVDEHVVKMILEYAQIMATVKNLNNEWTAKMPRPIIGMNRAPIDWCRNNDWNYVWLYDMWLQLMKEYTYRYGKVHKYDNSVLRFVLKPKKEYIRVEKIIVFEKVYRDKVVTKVVTLDCLITKWPAPAKSYEVFQQSGVLYTHRLYYVTEKSHLFKWTKRERPYWINELVKVE